MEEGTSGGSDKPPTRPKIYLLIVKVRTIEALCRMRSTFYTRS